MKKIAAILLALVLPLALCACGRTATPPVEELLPRVGTWELHRRPSYTYTFNADKTGYITSILEYPFTWFYTPATGVVTLLVEDGWGDIAERTLTIVSAENGIIRALDYQSNETVLCPKGSQDVEIPKGCSKPSELIGTWHSQNGKTNPLLLDAADGAQSGFYTRFDTDYILYNSAFWGVKGDVLYLFVDNGWQYKYSYTLKNGVLTLKSLYDEDVVYTFERGEPIESAY